MSRPFIIICLMISSIMPVAAETNLDLWLQGQQWQSRILLVFTLHLSHPAFIEQKADIARHLEGFTERDLITVTIQKDAESILVESNAHIASAALYKRFDVEEQDFTVILLGKDGGIKYRGAHLLSAEKLFKIIDAMPMRKAEMRAAH